MKALMIFAVVVLASTTLLVAACSQQTARAQDESEVSTARLAATAVSASGQPVKIEVTGQGFVPATIKARVGQALKLVVTRTTERTCATEIVIKEFNINRPLPLNQPVEVTLTPTKPGKIRYACGMDMIAGEIVVE